MIFYFSGTGNSRWAAQQLAEKTGDKALDIITLKELPSLETEKQVGLVFPIYAWGAPDQVLDFAKSLPKTDSFTFAVATCGSEAGHALRKLDKIFPLKSSYSLVMPNNYVVGSELEEPDVVRQIIENAKAELEIMAREIGTQTLVYRVKEGTAPGLKSGIVNYRFNHFARSTKAFYVTDACVGCGLCARNCPAGIISMEKERPVWGKECYQCLRCINQCPERAIQYGKATLNRGRYTIESYLEKKS